MSRVRSRCSVSTPTTIRPVNYLLLPGGAIRRIDPPVVFRSTAQLHEVLARHLNGVDPLLKVLRYRTNHQFE